MKREIKKGLAGLLALTLSFGMGGIQAPQYARAAEEMSFSCTKKSIAIDGTYLMQVEGITDSNATYSWSSSAPGVAVVSSKGLVTGISEGTTTIKCKVTTSDKSTQTLSCKVTVKKHKPANSVKINNAKRGTINAHTISIGESYDFNRTISPAGSNDKTYWYIQDEDYAVVDSNGIVTGLKEGITMLVAKSGIDRVEAELKSNTVTDYVYLNIVSAEENVTKPSSTPEPSATPLPSIVPTTIPTLTITPSVTVFPTATVTPTAVPTVSPTPLPGLGEAVVADVTLRSFDELVIVFGKPVVKSDVVKTNGVLSDYITVTPRSNALDYGTLTGELSQDGMTLVIRATDGFQGVYQISVASGIRTTAGGVIASYSEQKRLADTSNPYYVETKIDAKGYINTICFSEEVDISGMEIVGVENCSMETEAILTSLSSYVLSEDGRSLTVDLSSMSSEDENKDMVVVINGIRDKAGNLTNPYSLRIKLHADTKFRSIANVVSVERVSLTEVVATFDGALLDAGELTVGNYTVPGEVNPQNEFQAIYELNDMQSKLTGRQVVTISKWYSYYATGASVTPKKSVIDFTPSVTSPTIQETSISQTTIAGAVTTNIILTYNKDVSLLYPSGTLSMRLDDNGGYIIPMSVAYSAEAEGKVVTITINDSQMSASGTYTVTIPEYFCEDTYHNYSAEKSLTLEVDLENSTKLPAPYEITQDPDNASVVYVKFANMLDKTSAQTIKNYVINGATPQSASLVEQTQNGATVKLTLSPKTIQYTGTYPVQVKNVKGYGDTLHQMEDYKTMVSLSENTAPTVESAKMISTNEVVLKFRESSQLQGTPDFAVYLPGSSNNIALYSYLSDDNTVHIELSSVTSGYVIVKPTSLCVLSDINGNKASLEESYNALRNY